MVELLRDGIWQFAGFVVGIASVAVAWYIFKKQQPVKQIGYSVSSSRIMSRNVKVGGLIEVIFKGKKTVDPYLLTINIINNGTMPIPPNDYEAPLTLDLGKQANVLSAEIVETHPDDINQHNIIDKWEDQYVVFDRFLMNSKDSIMVQVLVDEPSLAKLTARITGGSITYINSTVLAQTRLGLMVATGSLLIFAAVFSLFFANMFQSNTLILSWYDFLLGIIVTLMLSIIFNFLTKTWQRYTREVRAVTPSAFRLPDN